jgi:hypothetical protein
MVGMEIEKQIETFKRHVLAGGGQWVGLQTAMTISDGLDKVMFKSPTTGIVLSVDADQCYSENIHKIITMSDKQFSNRKITLRRETVVYFLDNLKKLAAELEHLLEEKKHD